jgi:hypothetical protein
MSDIQDLIHKTTMDCLARGRNEERSRIVNLLEKEIGDMRPIESHSIGVYDGLNHAIELIKEETA